RVRLPQCVQRHRVVAVGRGTVIVPRLFSFSASIVGDAPRTRSVMARNPTAWGLPAARPPTAARHSVRSRPVTTCSVTMIRIWSAPASAGAAGRASTAPVTRTLIVLCCAVFLLGPASGLNPLYGAGEELLAAQQTWIRRWGVIPAELFEGSPAAVLTPATALFVHASWVHLLGNMLFLHVFGVMTEKRMGRARFTLFCLG